MTSVKRRVNRCCAPCAVIVMLVMVRAVVASQDQPDFSGRWVLESASQRSPSTPRALSVRQTLVRTNALGEPMAPFFRDVVVERELESGTRAETFLIGVVGGVGGGTQGSDRAIPRRYHAVKWDGNSLAFESSTSGGEASGVQTWTERREVWSLDPDGRLRVTIDERSSHGPPATITLIYKRATESRGPASRRTSEATCACEF